MTTSEEWSVNFDILYNNISSDQAPGLTEYEKSVFLTQAQEAVILDLYKGTSGDAFETTEEVTRYLSSLVVDGVLFPKEGVQRLPLLKMKIYTYKEPDDLWFITFLSGNISVSDNTKDAMAIPTRQDSLYKDLNNPFKGPNKNRVLYTSEQGCITVYSKYTVSDMHVKYLKRPNNIDLESVSFNVEIPESLHNQVLYKAVQLAKAVWQS